VELRHLRYFVAVAEEAHLGRAARRLHVAQSALSRQVQDLEREVGVALLERTPRGLRVAPAGRVFLDHARRALAEVEAGARAAREAAGGDAVLRLAPPDWHSAVRRVALAADAFRERMPGTLVDLDPTPWPLHPAALRERRIDVGFGIGVAPSDFAPDVDAVWLTDETSSYALLPAAHPLAAREHVALADLRDLPLLVPGRDVNAALHDHMVSAVRAGGVEPRLGTAPASFAAGAQFIAAGGGWTLVTQSTMDDPPPGTVVRRIVDVRKALGMFVLHRSGEDRPIVRTFLDCLAAAFADADSRR
jgi:DNA-binding transcriptional LysR family regulator